jgi:hypothetical protein
MTNRRQTNAGPGGAPREGPAALKAFLRLRDDSPTDVAFVHTDGAGVDIGRAGQPGHFSS